MKEPFFCFRSNFRAITRLETLATQATKINACYHVCMKQPVFNIIYFSIEVLKREILKQESAVGKGKLAGSYSTNRRGLFLLSIFDCF